MTLVGHALLQGFFTIWLFRLTWREGGLRLVIVAFTVLGLTYGAGNAGLVLEPWNPHVALPLFVLFLFQAWLLARGDLARLLGLAVTASLLVQVHIGYLSLVGAALATAGAFLWIDRRAGTLALDGARRHVRQALLAAGLLWLLPLVDEIIRWPDGNVRQLFEYFALGRASDSPAGFTRAAGIVADSFRLPPPWLGGNEAIGPLDAVVEGASSAWLLLPLTLGLVAALAVNRTRSRDDARALVLSSVLLVVAIAAVSRVTGGLTSYLVNWRTPIAVAFVIVALGCIVRWSGALDRPVPRVVIGVTLGAVASLAYIGLARAVIDHPDEVRDTEDEAAALLAPLDELGLPRGPTIIRYAGSPLPGLQPALVNELDREGHDVRVDDGTGWQWGYGRESAVSEVDEVWYATWTGQYTDLLTELPGARVVVELSPLSDADEAEYQRLDRQVAAELVAAGRPEMVEAMSSELFSFAVDGIPGVDMAAAARLGELNTELAATGGCRCAIVAFPADQAPPLGIAELPPASWAVTD